MGETQTLVGLAHEEEGGGADVVGDGAAGDAHRAAKEVAAAELGRDGVEARDAERAARGAAAQRVDDAVRDDDADGDAVARAQEAHERERRRVGVARQRDEVAVRGVHVALVDARVRDQHAAPQRRDHVRQHAQHLVRVVQHLLHKALGHLCPGVVAVREQRENQREVTRRKKLGCKLGCNGLGGVAGGNVGAAEDEALGHRAHLAADDNDVARAELLPVLGQVRLEQPRNLRNALAVRLHDAVRPHANALQPRELSLTLFLSPQSH